jgi:DNA-binding MarR family transcriptional regulator
MHQYIEPSMHSPPPDLWHALVAFRHRVMDRMQDGLAAMSELDLSLPQSIALFQVAEFGPLTVSALQARLKRSQATTSHLVSQLEKKGLLARSDDPDDARRTLVKLSKKGRQLVDKVEAIRREGFEQVLGALPAKVRRQLEDALRVTIEALEVKP